MRRLFVISLFPLALWGQAPTRGCAHIQLRFVDSAYGLGPGSVTPHARRIYRSSANGWSYALNDTVVLDERAIASVDLQSVRIGSDTAWAVIARPTVPGARALSDATGSHVGRYLGIVIGDDLVDTPRIESQLVGSLVLLRGAAPRAVAESLAYVARSAIAPICLTQHSPGTTYFEFQVTKPVAIGPGNVPPTYPTSLREAKISGEVLAQFVVDTLGHADMGTFHVLKSTDSLFAKAVEAVLPRYQFIPAELTGRKVRQLVQMPFQFNFSTAPPPSSSPPSPSVRKLFNKSNVSRVGGAFPVANRLTP